MESLLDKIRQKLPDYKPHELKNLLLYQSMRESCVSSFDKLLKINYS